MSDVGPIRRRVWFPFDVPRAMASEAPHEIVRYLANVDGDPIKNGSSS